MCDSPIKIKNLNCFTDRRLAKRLADKQPWKDFTSDYIEVPCGHCRSCIRTRQDSLVQRVQMESQKNHFFMCTLTYNERSLPRHEVTSVDPDSGEVHSQSIRYADTHDLQNTLKMLRKDNAFGIPFRYLGVSEMGTAKGRPHFHILFAFPKKYFPVDKDAYIAACDSFASKKQHYFTVLKYWRRNYGSRRSPKWDNLTDYKEIWSNGQLRKNYDFHYVNPFLTKSGVEDCGYYVLKYMFKPSERALNLKNALRLNLDDKDYKEHWNIVRPRYFASIGFGYNAKVQLKQGIYEKDQDIIDELKRSVKFSRSRLDFPAYINPYTGKASLLSPYYLSHNDVYDFDDRRFFWDKRNIHGDKIPGDFHDGKDISYTDIFRNKDHYEKTIVHCDSIGFDADLDLLD